MAVVIPMIAGYITGSSAVAFATNIMVQMAMTMRSGEDRRAINQIGPKIDDLQWQASAHGNTIPQVFGYARVSGNCIWKSKPKYSYKTVRSYYKRKRVDTTYRITEVSLAISVCQVPSLLGQTSYVREAEEADEITYTFRGGIAGIRRLWFNGRLAMDFRANNRGPVYLFDDEYLLKTAPSDAVLISQRMDIENYYGGETQQPSGYIENIEGAGNVPGYRDQAYVLLKHLDLTPFGAVPTVHAEIIEQLDHINTEENAAGMTQGSDGHIYVANALQRTITRFDSATMAVVSTIGRSSASAYLGDLKSHPMQMATSPIDGDLWVVCQGDDYVQRINLTTEQVTATVQTGVNPNDLVVDSNGYVWVTIPLDESVQKIDPITNSVIATVAAAGAWRIHKHHADGHLWVTGLDGVHRIDPVTDTVLATIATGYFPFGITSNPTNNYVWVASAGHDVVQIINPATNTIVRSINTGTYAYDVDTHPNDSYGIVWVSNYSGNRVKSYSTKEGFRKNYGYMPLIEFGTISFPGEVLALADGSFAVSNMKLPLVQIGEGY